MTTRRDFVATTIAAIASVTLQPAASALSATASTNSYLPQKNSEESPMKDTAEDPRITRARLSGPEQVTKNATVAVMGVGGTMTVLVKGTNEWVCVPGDENKIGAPPMCMNPMGMRWMLDAMQGKPAH
jgi:hypothetical protein